jgi:ATP-dependent RNA helicase DHX8/PRP22
MAKRVSTERGIKELGGEVGYTVRFDDVSDKKRTIIKYVTDGILVRECLIDPDLSEYSVVILDEAHERSLNTDILFALVKQAVLRRQGTLRLVITSATLRTDQLSSYYYSCPLLSVSGRCFPVSILH